MVEFKIIYPEMEIAFKDWTHYKTDWQKPSKVNFAVYIFRINGIEYTEYSEEFIKAYNGDLLWSKIKNEDSEEWLNAYMERIETERENATTLYNIQNGIKSKGE